MSDTRECGSRSWNSFQINAVNCHLLPMLGPMLEHSMRKAHFFESPSDTLCGSTDASSSAWRCRLCGMSRLQENCSWHIVFCLPTSLKHVALKCNKSLVGYLISFKSTYVYLPRSYHFFLWLPVFLFTLHVASYASKIVTYLSTYLSGMLNSSTCLRNLILADSFPCRIV